MGSTAKAASPHNIFGRRARYRGTQGTAIVGLFGRAAAMTGASEKTLRRAGRPFRMVYVHPAQHAGYYPGAEPMTLKLLFEPADGRILGAQVVGGEGVDKRIDVLAVAIQAGMTVFDLEEMELAYAPQFGSAKDPINMAGFVASGLLRGDHPQIDVAALMAISRTAVNNQQTRSFPQIGQIEVRHRLVGRRERVATVIAAARGRGQRCQRSASPIRAGRADRSRGWRRAARGERSRTGRTDVADGARRRTARLPSLLHAQCQGREARTHPPARRKAPSAW